MFRFREVQSFAAIVIVILLSGISSSALAFNPQPEPPANLWRVEGFINMTSLEISPTGDAMPFAVDSTIVGDNIIDFRSGIIAKFTAPDNTGGGIPDDGTYTAEIEYFQVQIGDTGWDETMPTQNLEFQIQGGLVTGVRAVITETMPAHPDLEFNFPASPGAWIATDERDGDNIGTISGSYALMDGEVTDKAQISVVDGFIKLDTIQGEIPADSDCTLADHFGRMVFDDINGVLYICSQSGWITLPRNY